VTSAASDDDIPTGATVDLRLTRRLLHYVRPHAGLVAAALGCLIVVALIQLAGPLLTRYVIDTVLPARDGEAVVRVALLFAAAMVVDFCCDAGQTVWTGRLGQRVMHDLRGELFTHLQRLPITFFERQPVGRLVTRVTGDVEALNELFTSGVVAGFGDLFTLGAIAVVLWLIDWRLALAAFAVVPLVVLVSILFQRRVRGAYREIRQRVARIASFLSERLGGIRLVQLFGQEGREQSRFELLNRSHLEAQLRSITIYALYFPVIEFLTTLALASLIVSSASRVGVGALSVGTVAAFLQLVRRFFQPLQDLSEKYNILQAAFAAAERIFGLLDTPVDASASSLAGARPIGRGAGGLTVTFEHVWHHYGAAPAQGEPSWSLRDVSFTVGPGETLALVGHTGAGKTTIASLLLRFYEPQRGRILVDGVDIRALSVDALRARIGTVQQDLFFFAGDVADNIRLSSPLDDEAVLAAARQVGADEVINALPGGLRHPLGERGATVSVGERQLLALARAFAADPALLLLDEATSSVDSAREAALQRALATVMSGRTTIAIAHRLSTIVSADQILVLHHGQVVERGRHRELLSQGGRYARLFELQLGGGAGGGVSGMNAAALAGVQ
jgi:ATP-binding cassette, subfamily B, multidrug efflux pump